MVLKTKWTYCHEDKNDWVKCVDDSNEIVIVTLMNVLKFYEKQNRYLINMCLEDFPA